MENLWSPWRMKYVTDADNSGSCVFCTAPTQADSSANLIVHRGTTCYTILNRYPYTSGHVMVVPFVHVSGIDLLTPEVRIEMFEMVNTAIGVLRAVYQPEGFNIGINMGVAGGAGISEHAHIHIVPRWAVDAHFMSTTGETRVIPEDLGVTFRRISENWK
jgi:ATP adenylyltransferase